MTSKTMADSSLLSASITVPQHVVYRSFPSETVVLNLETGLYYGLNPAAGHMLDVLVQVGNVRAAASSLAHSFGQPMATIEQDLCELCEALRERGLVEISGAGAL